MLNTPTNRRKTGLTLYLEKFKSPIGYMRAVEVVIAIVTITAVSCWNLKLEYSCRSNTSTVDYNVAFSTFHLSQVKLEGCEGKQTTLWHHNDDATPNVRFFYIVLSFSLAYSLFIAVIYTFYWNKYIQREHFAIADLGVSLLLTVLSLICACVWWGGANIISWATNDESVRHLLTENANFWDLNSENMKFNLEVNNWVLVISVVLCYILWLLHTASLVHIVKALIGKIANDDF